MASDPFQKLPVEIILTILHYTADFAGVDGLLRGSKTIRAVFQANSSRIVEDILATCSSTSYKLHELFRTVARIRTPSFKPANFTSFISHLDPNPNSSSTFSIDESTARSMVSIAARIQRLACACLLKLFDNLRSTHNTILPLEWIERSAKEPFSWIEEFRVYRALWRLQIHSDLRRAVKPDPEAASGWGGWTWTLYDIDRITTTYFDNRWPLDYEAQGISDVLIELGAKPPYTLKQPIPWCQQVNQRSRDRTYPVPLFASFDISTPTTRDGQGQALWCTPPIPEDSDLNLMWGRSRGDNEHSSQGLSYNTSQILLTLHPGHLPTGLDDMRPFYRLGVFVWDAWRMYSVGLKYINEAAAQAPDGTWFIPPHPGRFASHNIVKRWCSLIGAEIGGQERTRRLVGVLPLY